MIFFPHHHHILIPSANGQHMFLECTVISELAGRRQQPTRHRARCRLKLWRGAKFLPKLRVLRCQTVLYVNTFRGWPGRRWFDFVFVCQPPIWLLSSPSMSQMKNEKKSHERRFTLSFTTKVILILNIFFGWKSKSIIQFGTQWRERSELVEEGRENGICWQSRGQ